MKFFILIAIVFTLSFVAYNQDAFAILGCDNPHCYSLVQSSRSSPIEGISYELDSPDLWVDRNACLNIAVSTGWLVANTVFPNTTPEWVESGVTKGYVENVGCVTQLSTYYAINNVNDGIPRYQEYLVPNGRVDPGDNIKIKLQENNNNQVQIFVNTPDITSSFPRAQISLNPANVYFADFGIEGTISASDEYSSIPMSKFTNLKIKQNGSWNNLPSSASIFNSHPGEGFIGKKCGSTGFVAGSVMSLDCNIAATRNQAPIVDNQVINISTNAPFTINLSDRDTDKDYLTYSLVTLPTNGFLNYNNRGAPIPNTDGDSAKLVYTPASSIPESDTLKYSVTDKRDGHTREGLVTIIGPTSAPSVPDPVDDFAFTLDGTTIKFTWSHPYDGGSELTYYEVERSYDTIDWRFHDSYSETVTSFDWVRHEGYDQYFRIFAHNDNGISPSSNVIHVHIRDTTPPDVRIDSPINNENIITPEITVNGNIYEGNNSGIDNIKIWIDSVLRSEPILVTVQSDTVTLYDSILKSIPNGNYLLMVTAENGDGVLGSKTISITLDAPIPKQVSSFEDNFESDMAEWYLATEDDKYWSVRENSITPIPGEPSSNSVAGTEDCDRKCTMTMVDYVDLTNMKKPQFDFNRYLSSSLDTGEGLEVYVSQDNGAVWGLLDSFMADDKKDDNTWHLESYDLSNFSDVTEFKVKFVAISTSGSEDTELDNVRIYDVDADTTPPVITVPVDQTFEATAVLTRLTTSDYGIATAIDNVDGSVSVTSNAGISFQLGKTMITWTATDSSGNTSTSSQIITINDTTSPIITPPANITVNATGAQTTVTIGDATATDIFSVTMNDDAPNTFPIGNTIITYTATDSNGNTSSATQSITVEGNAAITFTGEWMANNVLDIRFTQDVTPHLERSDFTVSSGEILGFYTWYQMDNRLIFLMENIPENEILTVTYVGDGLDIGDYRLYPGEKLVTSPNPGLNLSTLN